MFNLRSNSEIVSPVISIGNFSFPLGVDFKGLYYFDFATETYVPVLVEIDLANNTILADWRYILGKVVFRQHEPSDNYTIEISYGQQAYAFYNTNQSRSRSLISAENNYANNSTASNFKSSFSSPPIGGTRNPQGTNVVLNEIFPDQKTNEWIELYNPTTSTIDLSGWTITTSAGTYTFPGAPNSGTVTIGPGQFLVLDNTDFGNNFLKNSDTVILRDSSNNNIDQTSYRGVSKDRSWARYKDPTGADGYDTDQDSDWYKENNPTKGASNTTTIPEYDIILLPLGILLLMMFVIYRRKSTKLLLQPK